MKLSVSSASFAAAFAVLAPAHSNSVMASAVDAAYENKVEQVTEKHIQSRSLGEECSFASFGLRGNEADTGILGCAEDFVCVEDRRSSLGGHCVSVDMKHRELQTHTPTTSCTTKCTPASACEGLTPAFISTIPDGSCCGEKACSGVTGTTTIGVGSCIGFKACHNAVDATIGSGSCTGDKIKGPDGYYGYSCAFFKGVVGDNSCYEYSACYQSYAGNTDGYPFGLTFNIGDNSCKGDAVDKKTMCAFSAKDDGSLSIGDNSCNDFYACYGMTGSVGDGSCNNDQACKYNYATIYDGVCNQVTQACYKNNQVQSTAPTSSPSKSPSTPPPTSSPTASPSKSPSTSPTSSPTTSPTTSSAPSVAPTKSPSASPTTSSAPSGAPTNNPTKSPTNSPTASPTSSPTQSPTKKPTNSPTLRPTNAPTNQPTVPPTTLRPTNSPTSLTTTSKSGKTAKNSKTKIPASSKSKKPTIKPTIKPTKKPTKKTKSDKGTKKN